MTADDIIRAKGNWTCWKCMEPLERISFYHNQGKGMINFTFSHHREEARTSVSDRIIRNQSDARAFAATLDTLRPFGDTWESPNAPVQQATLSLDALDAAISAASLFKNPGTVSYAATNYTTSAPIPIPQPPKTPVARFMCELCKTAITDARSLVSYNGDEITFLLRCHSREEQHTVSQEDIYAFGEAAFRNIRPFLKDAETLAMAAAKKSEPPRPALRIIGHSRTIKFGGEL